MNAGVERRLVRLEAATAAVGTKGLAELLEAGRRRARETSEVVLGIERQQRFTAMQARHAAVPLRGLELRMMEGLGRVVAFGQHRAAVG